MHQDRQQEFIHRLAQITLADLDEIAAAIECSMVSSADWLEWRRALAVADDAVRRLGRSREAGVAAHEAAATVLTTLDAQMTLPDARVTMVARAARQAAAALVAVEAEPRATATILRPWRSLLDGSSVAA
ncbi:MAG TPA: hypothetical protein VI916_06670 [Acidimicrobiia bacterium]|nr:hypothetical protein [Acidimicrobiia bacterium]